MSIEYKNTFLDLFRYQISHQFLMPVFQGFFLIFTGYIFFDQYYLSNEFLSSLLVALFFYLAMWLLQVIFILVLLLLTKRTTLTTRHIIKLDDEGLHEESAFNRTVHFWKGGIVKVRRRAGCIAIYVTPLSAHIVPVRAFRTVEDAALFQREIESRLRAA